MNASNILNWCRYQAISRLRWQVNADQYIERYRIYASLNHLEIGVSTCSMLEHANKKFSRLVLSDTDQQRLTKQGNALQSYKPETYVIDGQLGVPCGGMFDSIGCNNYLHGFKGNSFTQKMKKNLDAIYPKMNTGCIFFGSTIFTAGSENIPEIINRWYQEFYEDLGWLHDTDKTLYELGELLPLYFSKISLIPRGDILLFSGEKITS